jgi:hypothetical protein
VAILAHVSEKESVATIPEEEKESLNVKRISFKLPY